MGCPVCLNDFGEGSQGFINFCGVRKHGPYSRLKHHNVAANREASRELVVHRTTEVVLRKNLFAINFGRRCFTALALHNLSVLDALPALLAPRPGSPPRMTALRRSEPASARRSITPLAPARGI